MRRCRWRVLVWSGVLALAVIAVGSQSVAAADYPTKAVTLIAPYPPGGTIDGISRAIAEGARKYLPRPVAVVNRPGGAGSIGVAEVYQAKPDGYLLVTTGVSVLAIVPQTTELPYTGPEDFSHIICVASTPIVLAVQATAPYKSIKEFLDASRSSPNKVRVATSGTGASNNIEAHRLNRAGNAGFLIVPYTGGGEPIAALLGGHVDATVDTPLTLYPHAQAGKLRILAVFGPARIPSAPEVPTLVESGIDLVSSVYYSITGPKGMQPEVVRVLHDAFKKGMEEEIFTRFLRNSHLQSMYLSGKDTHARLRSDFEVYGKVLDQIGIKKK